MLAKDESIWINAEDIEESITNWLWWPYIAAEHINIIAGMGNEGKGLVCTHIAACVTKGRAFPECPERHPPANVVWCEMEDDLGSTIKPRLKAAGADLSKVTVLHTERFLKRTASQARDYIGEVIAELKPRLLILSPMNSFLGGININDELAIRSAFEELRGCTIGYGTAILGISHANKKVELSAIERISGSVAYVNFCRSVMFVVAEPGDDPNRRRFVHGKWNMSTKGEDLIYTSYYDGHDKKQRDQYVRLRWERPLNDIDHKKTFSDEEKQRESTGDWVVRYLQETGPIPVAKLKEDANRLKRKWGSIEQARLRLNAQNGELMIDSTDGVWSVKKREARS